MSITTIIFIVLFIVFMVAYAKSLKPELRKQQADLATKGITVGLFATTKVVKELITVVAKSGTVVGNEIQLSHQESINEIDSKFKAELAKHRGSTKRMGIAIGESVNDTLMITPASKNLDETLAIQKARAAKLEELYASQA